MHRFTGHCAEQRGIFHDNNNNKYKPNGDFGMINIMEREGTMPRSFFFLLQKMILIIVF
jgi:hypothetical protein